MKKYIIINYHKKEGNLKYLGILVLFTIALGCKKFVEVNPPATLITATTVYSNNTSAAAVMSSVYSNMSSTGLSSGQYGLSLSEGMASDELTNYFNNSIYPPFYQNALTSNVTDPSGGFWTEIYKEIHVANTEIEGISSSSGITLAMKRQLDGEAKFIRAFYHFYVTNLFGDVPLVTTTNYLANNVIKRTPQAQVYEQIIKDLKDAQLELSKGFVDANGNTTTERIRPNRGAAQALLARAYLYTGDWANAKIETDSVINNTANYSLLTDLIAVFKKNSGEAIWQLTPVVPNGYNTNDAPIFVLTGPPGNSQNPVALSNYLLNSFEPNDKRFNNWVGVYKQPNTTNTYYYPFKYKAYQNGAAIGEYLMVFRLAEQYLIRAEAEANGAGSGLSAAVADLNIIRTRAGLPNYAGSPTDKAAVLNAILHERQVELFTEWGHRWFDLIRTNNINSVMGSSGNVCQAKGGTWASYKALAPIPLAEIKINSNLTQNTGY